MCWQRSSDVIVFSISSAFLADIRFRALEIMIFVLENVRSMSEDEETGERTYSNFIESSFFLVLFAFIMYNLNYDFGDFVKSRKSGLMLG